MIIEKEATGLNNREKYLTNWFKVINWKLVSKNYEEMK